MARSDITKLIVFDWDGTVSDSLARIAQCVQLAAGEHQLDIPPINDIKEIVGLSLPKAMAQLFPTINEDKAESLRKGYSAHYKILDQKPCPFFPTAMSALTRLKKQGYLLAVATGKSRQGLDRVLRALDMDDFFHGSRCADETRSKPDPQMLNELLAEFSIEPKQAVMVGDTEFDMEMAFNAGVPRVAVSYGAHAVERLQVYQPIACIDKLKDIERYL